VGVVLIGTVESSYRVLETLIDLKAPVDCVMSLAPENAIGVSDYVDLRPLAVAQGIAHNYITQVNDPEVLSSLAKQQPDVIFVIGWSQLIKRELLSIPRFGCIGAHPALLPRNRGRAVIPWALICDEPVTGMTLFHIDEGIDSGDIIAQFPIPISDSDTARSLYDRAVDGLCFMIRQHLPAILNGSAPRIPQDESNASYCAKRGPDDGAIDWSQSSRAIFNLIRAVTRPYPGAFSFYGSQRVTVWAATHATEEWKGSPGQILRLDPTRGALVKTGDGTIWLTELEVGGKLVSATQVFKRVGGRLGTPDTHTLVNKILDLESRLTTLERNLQL
jgi:methionyl-tRNA formyltransferase